MDPTEVAKDFLLNPSKEALQGITEMIKANPAAAVAVVGVLGVAYITKIGLEAIKQN